MTGTIKATYEDHMGDDLRVVNAARVSFGKRSEWLYKDDPYSFEKVRYLKDADKRLIQFLARGCESREWDLALTELGANPQDFDRAEELLKWVKSMPTHWTPFGHTAITLIEEIPIFVARQRFKHTVGFVYNEISRRYVTDEPQFYQPDTWRASSANKKQGSSHQEADLNIRAQHDVYTYADEVLKVYNNLLASGVCAEQARMVLPQSMMTTYWVTGNLYSFAQAYKARSRPDAQKEIRDLAAEWDRIIRPLFPVSWAALVD